MNQILLLSSLLLIFSGCSTAQVEVSETVRKASSAKAVPVIIGNTYTINSSVFNAERRITVRVPTEYKSNEKKNYSVMFVIDGGPEQDFPHLAGMMQSIDLTYTVEPLILVGIETENRRYEITPPAADPRYDVIAKERGGANEFREYIRNDVIPWVKKNYRVSEDFAVIGESLAGLFVIETFLNEPELFTRYAAISPSLWWDELSVTKNSKSLLNNLGTNPKQLYLTMGNEGWQMQAGLDLLVEALVSDAPDNLSWSYTDRSNSEEHASIYHPAALDVLRTFYLTPHKTGFPLDAFYMFPNGKAPDGFEKNQANFEKECNLENAIKTTFEETNANRSEWNGVCVLIKPGTKSDMGSQD